ncbi:MAG: type IV pilus biogenesis/stability protein PilW [Pseudomonadota bacterium]
MKSASGKIGIAVVVVIAALLSGCASTQTGGSQAELATTSDQTELQRRAQIRLQLGTGYYQQGQMNIALDEIKQALQMDPNFADAYSMRAIIYMDMGEARLAEENFSRAMKLAPNNPDLSNNYGWFLCQNGRERQSIAYFEAALKNRSYQSPAKALNNAGMCSLKLKDHVAAEAYFVRAFQFEPGNLDTNLNLAKSHYARGDYQRARFYITRVTKADRLTADVLWTAIKVERKVGDKLGETALVTQLRRRHPDSPEYAAYVRGAFDE